MAKSRHQTEFGDFQTPDELARQVCAVIRKMCQPLTVLEPTCGKGSLLDVALQEFRQAVGLGLEIHPEYVDSAVSRLAQSGSDGRGRVEQSDFFSTDWKTLINGLAGPLLVIGNPPWVTNSTLGSIGGQNLPRKRNSQGLSGMDAKTGKSNFDISEWMLSRLVEAIEHRPDATLAMLCKTAVARKVLAHAWKSGLRISRAAIHRIDSSAYFGAAVDACLFVCVSGKSSGAEDCDVYDALGQGVPRSTLGFRNQQLVADIHAYERVAHLRGNCPLTWRSGIKHDCSRVMELKLNSEGVRRNGFDEVVTLEDEHLYPMLKGSELRRWEPPTVSRWMLVTQKSIGDPTDGLSKSAPRTWRYLERHGEHLDARASSIYRGRPRFSIFGVGPYTFAPWKVAIAGLYKRLEFRAIGPVAGRPVVFDDTTNFLPCETEAEAEFIASMLNSKLARDFYSALVFWDSKRPITVGLLSQLDLIALAKELSLSEKFRNVSKVVRHAGSQGRLLPVG